MRKVKIMNTLEITEPQLKKLLLCADSRGRDLAFNSNKIHSQRRQFCKNWWTDLSSTDQTKYN